MKKEDKESIRVAFGWAVIYMTIKSIIEFYRNLYRDYKEERDKRDDNSDREKSESRD